MYIVKIVKDNQIIQVLHYKHFENAMADVADHILFDAIPDDIIASMGEWGNPRISCHGYETSTGLADDFEFIYPCGIHVYVGTILFEDDKKDNVC